MDKNSITGLLLMVAILVAYTWYTAPTEQELAAKRQTADSLKTVKAENARRIAEAAKYQASGQLPEVEEQLAADGTVLTSTQKDSVLLVANESEYGIFAAAAQGTNEYYEIENDLIKLKIASKGGRIVDAQLKEYQTYDSLPLSLVDEDSSTFNIKIYSNRNHYVNSADLFLISEDASIKVDGENTKSLKLKMATSNPNEYIEYVYSLTGGSYLVDFDVNFVGLENVASENKDMILNWDINAPFHEKHLASERQKTTIFYKVRGDEVDYLSETSNEDEDIAVGLDWISFKEQYFSLALISKDGFPKGETNLQTYTNAGSKKYTRNLKIQTLIDVEKANAHLQMYVGPNHYQTLEALDINLQDQIDLGWGIFGWVNEFIVIPLFNFLDGFNLGYGLIIFILTITIKTALFPLTYKNFKSSAMMKVLKPEIEEINKKFEGSDDMMKKQQATMALYKSAGVNPMAGCVPMLLQMPILYAMFRFFPASIELRQEAFLWAEDLSSFDSIYDLGFSIPMYGDHISLFTLLMAGSTYLYTMTNSQMTAQTGPQAQQMKIMMYMMPVMMLGFFNNYAAGLSYYYLLANLMSVGQQMVIKQWFIDEGAIRLQIEQNKKKPQAQTKSKFQKKLEQLQKQKTQQSGLKGK